ncbi:DDHD domain-containing protein [Chlamydoabsidia padenii]|nr:DDHD domain-containing protein [Chlamydoabsidia padenii]
MAKSYSDHLVFFIHGMGQQYEEYGRLEHHVMTMQNNTEQVLQQQYPNEAIRIHYVAIEWHSVVHGLVDMKMEQATLETVPKVRLTANHWLMDCLYYFSKPYGQCIIDTVCQQCNEAYRQHVETWPDFEKNNGQVHMIGFSLGGVIGYDIASMQWNKEKDGPAPSPNHHQQHDPAMFLKDTDTLLYYHQSKPDLQVPLLEFPIRCLFTCGSPIAAALVFRGLDYIFYRPPPRTKVFNIFHPFDPLGYRIEPMLDPSYTSIRPVQLSRAQRQRILPKIPNLGIRSSFANAQPYITKARRTFWQYMSTNSSDSDTSSTEKETVNRGPTHQRSINKEASTTTQTSTTPSSSPGLFRSSIHRSSTGWTFVNVKNMATPVLSTFSATMEQQVRLSTCSPSPTLVTIKRLHAIVPHTTATPLKTLRTSFADDDNDDDYQSILFSDPIKDGFVSEEDDDDDASFITALTFDTLMEEDTSSSASTPNTSINTDCLSPTSLYESHHLLDPSTKSKRDGMDYNDDDDDESTTGILAMDGLMYPRLDYTLTETVIDTYGSEWIVAVKSHFKYWANRDLVLHMVNVMVNDK